MSSGLEGVLRVDGCSSSKALARAGPETQPGHCRAHAHRYVMNAEPGCPRSCAKAVERLEELDSWAEETGPAARQGAEATYPATGRA